MNTETHKVLEECPVEGLIEWTGISCRECGGKGFVSIPGFYDGEAICEGCLGDKIVWQAVFLDSEEGRA
jgi:formylmethanofuran dehydrogenase subunit E